MVGMWRELTEGDGLTDGASASLWHIRRERADDE